MPMDIRLRDRVEMKKPHPCGEKIFEITRVGMDVKLSFGGHVAHVFSKDDSKNLEW